MHSKRQTAENDELTINTKKTKKQHEAALKEHEAALKEHEAALKEHELAFEKESEKEPDSKTKEDALKQYKRVPEFFHELFGTECRLPISAITSEMKQRDHCGLLSQKHSLAVDEFQHAITFLADSNNWAIVLKLHVNVNYRSKQETLLLNYIHAHHEIAGDLTPQCACLVCQMALLLSARNEISSDMWCKFDRFLEEKRVNMDELFNYFGKPIQENKVALIWFWSYRGMRQWDHCSQLPYVVLETTLPHGMYPAVCSFKSFELVRELIKNKHCIMKTTWDEPRCQSLTLSF